VSDVEAWSEVVSARARRGSPVVDMPDHDDRIESLDAASRRAIADTWQRRAGEELKVATAFTILCRELLETGADGDVVMAASRAIHDEVRHGEICRILASRYRGEEVAWPPPVALRMRRAPGRSGQQTLLHVAEMCCANEAISATYLDASFAGATGACARAALRELLRDEVEHARFGWIYIGRAVASPRAREALAEHLVLIVQEVVGCWFDDSAITLRGGAPEDGLPSVAVMRACALTAASDILLPGFETLGFDVSAARSWLDTMREPLVSSAQAAYRPMAPR
jgi:hypothetical protein